MIRSTHPLVGRPIRRGTVVPLLAMTIVALVGFLALAIDLGMVAVSKAQAQQAADLAALTAARTVNGNPTGNYNVTAATTNAQNILGYNVILGKTIQASQLQLTYGSFDYNQTTQTFNANYPATAGAPYTAVASTVTASGLSGAFSSVFGNSFLPTVTATAQAVHRPRDVALVMDLSGSMRMGTCLRYDFYTATGTTNNPDANVPSFGQYSAVSSSLVGTGSSRTSAYDNYTISASNTTAPNPSYSLTFMNNFYQNAAYATPLVRAFDSATSSDGGNTWTPAGGTPQLPASGANTTTPAGDAPLFKSGSTTVYATDVKDVFNSSTANPMWELDGYSGFSAGQPDTSASGSVPAVWTQADYSQPRPSLPFNGYTKGPGYYGKTFFLWPPDPRNVNAMSSAVVKSYLTALGLNSADATTLTSGSPTIWTTWQGQGSTGLTNLQNWLKGTAKGGASGLPTFTGSYTPTSTTALVTGVTTWNGATLTAAAKPKTYYAVCRLFNRAYPGGAAWTSTSFSADWRVRFFGTNDNTKLFTSSGSLNPPGSAGMSSTTATYNAILTWLGATNDPFPTQLRAGRVKYYGTIPTSITGTWPSYGNTDQQFWVEVMDYTLGFKQTSAGVYTDISAMSGYGSDFTWGTESLAAPSATPPPYITYTDNPLRPLLRCWFGPLMMTDAMQNFNLWCNTPGYFMKQPGDSYEAPIYTAKQAFLAAVNTMENNHPNDWFTLVPFSWPRTGSTGADWTSTANTVSGRFNCVSCPLGTNYAYGSAALLFPLSTINADGSSNNTEVTPYDADPATSKVPSANFMDVPRADGETCPAMALMLCYNQFAVTPSNDSTLRTFATAFPVTFPTGMAGGLGRRGAQKVIIFETDGIPNTSASAPLTSAGSYNYYSIRYDMNRPYGSEYPTAANYQDADPTVTSQLYSVVSQLNTTYGTARNPFRLYAIGFGPVFQGASSASALGVLQNMQYYAGTQANSSTALPANQIITGTDAQMRANMISAYTNILQNGVQIALIK